MNKQTFQIPEGCKAITMEQVGNQIITTFEPEFKRGDILYGPCHAGYAESIAIFNKNIEGENNLFLVFAVLVSDNVYLETDLRHSSLRRHATPEEAQRLWDALAKVGKRWNPETMQVEEIKKEIPRAKYMENYYIVEYDSFHVFEASETKHRFDNGRHEIGNYFLTKEQAQRAADKLKSALDEFWKEELK